MAIDYTSFNSPGAANNTLTPAARWWLLDKKEIPQAVASIVNMLSSYDSRRKTQIQTSVRLYGNVSLMGVSGLSFTKQSSTQKSTSDRISYNLVQSVIDTLCNKMAKNKPKPLFLPSGGDYKMHKRAKKLTKFCDGIFYENKAYEMGPIILRDGCVAGDGVVHVYNDQGRVKFERVLEQELYVDEIESFYGHPRQIHRCKNIDRQVLIEMFPDSKKVIEAASRAKTDLAGLNMAVSDQITVVESWHLPSGPDADDGLHTICIVDQAVTDPLLYEPYTKNRFPFAFWKWSPRLYGFWGQGLAEQLQNIQLEINKLLWVIQRSMHLAGSFKIFVENGSKIVSEHFNNEFGSIIHYSGVPPQYVVPPIVPPEIYQHLITLKALGFEQAGISQLSAASQKPQGLNSGKALREMVDIESDRFIAVEQAYEDFFLDLADLAIDTGRDIYKETGKFSVHTPGKKFLEEIDWSDIDLERDEYIMQKFPVSSLPDDPAGRLETIQEYMQAGLISPRSGRRLLDFPDLEEAEKLANSEEEYLNQVVEKMVEEGITTRFEIAYDDPQLAREIALEQYAYGKANGLEEERLQLLRDYLDDISAQEAKLQAAAQPQAPAGAVPGAGAPPLANPAPTPTSNLVPNVASAS